MLSYWRFGTKITEGYSLRLNKQIFSLIKKRLAIEGFLLPTKQANFKNLPRKTVVLPRN